MKHVSWAQILIIATAPAGWRVREVPAPTELDMPRGWGFTCVMTFHQRELNAICDRERPGWLQRKGGVERPACRQERNSPGGRRHVRGPERCGDKRHWSVNLWVWRLRKRGRSRIFPVFSNSDGWSCHQPNRHTHHAEGGERTQFNALDLGHIEV